MAVKFIGNKIKLLGFIEKKIIEETGLNQGTFLDLFTGTTSVAMAFKKIGFDVIANDKLESSYLFSKVGLLINKDPDFIDLLPHLQIEADTLFEDPYDLVLKYLNNLSGEEGMFYKEYSPGGSKNYLTGPRTYFTDDNAKKIDAIRNKIALWHKFKYIDEIERSLLLATLIFAVNQIANISGTYGAYLKKWNERSLQSIFLTRYPLSYAHNKYKVYKEDANFLVKNLEHVNIVYIDPPYTKRQYNAYYHIPETIAIGDNPEVWGKTGQRPRKENDSSIYCYKKKAPHALLDLVESIKADYIFLSYSSDGHISHEEILNILSTRGTPKFWRVSYKRFKSNNPRENKNEELKEILYSVKIK